MDNLLVNEYRPDYAVSPGEVLEFELDMRGMKQQELAKRTGLTPKHIGAIVNAKSSITAETAIKLERAIGMPAQHQTSRPALPVARAVGADPTGGPARADQGNIAIGFQFGGNGDVQRDAQPKHRRIRRLDRRQTRNRPTAARRKHRLGVIKGEDILDPRLVEGRLNGPSRADLGCGRNACGN